MRKLFIFSFLLVVFVLGSGIALSFETHECGYQDTTNYTDQEVEAAIATCQTECTAGEHCIAPPDVNWTLEYDCEEAYFGGPPPLAHWAVVMRYDCHP